MATFRNNSKSLILLAMVATVCLSSDAMAAGRRFGGGGLRQLRNATNAGPVAGRIAGRFNPIQKLGGRPAVSAALAAIDTGAIGGQVQQGGAGNVLNRVSQFAGVLSAVRANRAGGGEVADGGFEPEASPVVTEEPVAQIQPEAQPEVAAQAGSVDLVLEDIEIAKPATLVAGPAYRVKFRNQGLQAAGKFEVGVFATADGDVSKTSPKSVLEVPGLAAGQSSEVVLRLPATAMKLVDASTGKAAAFGKLVVGVDFNDAVTESDKTNNVASVDRTDLEAK